MNQNDKLTSCIQDAIMSVKAYAQFNNLIKNPEIEMILNVLILLEKEMRSPHFNVRVLRAFKDVCTLIARNYEDTILFDKLFSIRDLLEFQIPQFQRLEILGEDFGKGLPI